MCIKAVQKFIGVFLLVTFHLSCGLKPTKENIDYALSGDEFPARPDSLLTTYPPVSSAEFFAKTGFNFHLQDYAGMPDLKFAELRQLMSEIPFGFIRDNACDGGANLPIYVARLNGMANPVNMPSRKAIILTSFGGGSFDPANDNFWIKHEIFSQGGNGFPWVPVPVLDKKTEIAFMELYNEPDHRASHFGPPTGLIGSTIQFPNWPTHLANGIQTLNQRIPLLPTSSPIAETKILLPAYVNPHQHHTVIYDPAALPEAQISTAVVQTEIESSVIDGGDIGIPDAPTRLDLFLKEAVHPFAHAASIHPYDSQKPAEFVLGEILKRDGDYQGFENRYVGEFGWAGHAPGNSDAWVSEQTQANFTLRGFAYFIEQGAEAALVYEFLDSNLLGYVPAGIQQRFGLVAVTGSMINPIFRPKPVFTALKNFASAMGAIGEGGSLSSTPLKMKLEVPNGSKIHHMVYQDPNSGDYRIIIWNAFTAYRPDLADVGTHRETVRLTFDSNKRVQVFVPELSDKMMSEKSGKSVQLEISDALTVQKIGK